MVMQEKFAEVSTQISSFNFFLFMSLLFQTILIPVTSSNMTPVYYKIGNNGWDQILEL